MKNRTLSTVINQASKSFPVLLVTGPRQVGKTTLLAVCAENDRKYVTLDDLTQRELAKSDPAQFLETFSAPVIIDEVQYAPELFSYIKMAVDQSNKPGMFWLTGSQKFHLMQGINESLAGRLAIIDMLGLSQAEIQGRADAVISFLPTKDWLEVARKHAKKPKSLMEVYHNIWLGSYPRVNLDPEMSRDLFYKSYVQTYIQRDVKDILNISNELSFNRFLRAVAARTGQMLNYSDLARDVDVDHKTIKSWLSVLEASGLIYLLYPYFNNVTKRLVKTPKVYFLDTGLCSYLTHWPSPESLEAGAMSGSILETYMFAEILKSYWHVGKAPYFHYYRDTDQREIDLVLESGDTLYPVEFKKTTAPKKSAIRHFSVLEKLGKKVGHGGIVCLRKEDIPLSSSVHIIPLGYI